MKESIKKCGVLLSECTFCFLMIFLLVTSVGYYISVDQDSDSVR